MGGRTVLVPEAGLAAGHSAGEIPGRQCACLEALASSERHQTSADMRKPLKELPEVQVAGPNWITSGT
jgi:hypothetical protein